MRYVDAAPSLSERSVSTYYDRVKKVFEQYKEDKDIFFLQRRLIAALPKDVDKRKIESYISSIPFNEEFDVDIITGRLVGTLHLIRKNINVSSDLSELETSWNIAEILEFYSFKKENEEVVTRMVLKVTVGKWAGKEILYEMPARFNYMFKLRIGFTGTKDYLKDELYGSKSLCGLKLMVNLKEEDNRIRILAYHVPVTLANKNRKLISARNLKECPYKMKPVNCDRCVLGRDKCPLALKAKSWEEQYCKRCGKTGWIDPRHPSRCHLCKNVEEVKLFTTI